MNKRRKKSDNRGTTLVETVVTMALISLFMVAATKVIANTAMVYYQAKGISTGMQVSGIINTKVSGVIEGAMAAPLADTEANGGIVPYMLISEEGIEMTDNTGSHVLVRAINPDDVSVEGPRYMEIYYYPADTEEEGVTPPAGTVQGTVWTFDKKAYMGYSVQELSFEQINSADYNKNMIKMTLVLYSPKYGEYSSTTYIECYNFQGNDADLIVTK